MCAISYGIYDMGEMLKDCATYVINEKNADVCLV